MLTHLTPTTPAASVIGEVHRVLNAETMLKRLKRKG